MNTVHGSTWMTVLFLIVVMVEIVYGIKLFGVYPLFAVILVLDGVSRLGDCFYGVYLNLRQQRQKERYLAGEMTVEEAERVLVKRREALAKFAEEIAEARRERDEGTGA